MTGKGRKPAYEIANEMEQRSWTQITRTEYDQLATNYRDELKLVIDLRYSGISYHVAPKRQAYVRVTINEVSAFVTPITYAISSFRPKDLTEFTKLEQQPLF